MPSELQPLVRPLRGEDELRAYFTCLRTAFLDASAVTDEALSWVARHVDRDRSLGAFVDGALCATAGSFAAELTVPGGLVTAAAVTQVSVLPTHRRRGLLTSLMTHQLEDIGTRGEPLAMLIASEWPIYGRFGYGAATEVCSIELETSQVCFRDAVSGSVALVRAEELRKLAPGIYDECRVFTVGALGRSPSWWDELTGVDPRPNGRPAPRRMQAVWRDDAGRPQGYVVYDTESRWEHGRPRGRLTVVEMMGATTEAHRELWRYVVSVDLVTSVVAPNARCDDPLPHLVTDGRTVVRGGRFDHLWVRLLDVPAALAARRYRAAGRLVLDVHDDVPGVGGRFALTVEGAACSVERSAGAADLTMPISTLGAAYLGGTPFAVLAAAGLVREDTAGSVARADTMFGVSPAPFLTSHF